MVISVNWEDYCWNCEDYLYNTVRIETLDTPVPYCLKSLSRFRLSDSGDEYIANIINQAHGAVMGKFMSFK